MRKVALTLGALVVSALVVLPAPTQAYTLTDVGTPLPISHLGTILRLPGDESIAVTGGADPTVVVDLRTRAATPVPGTAGVTALTLSADGTTAWGPSPEAGEVVAIDLERRVARRVEVGGCPLSAVERQGYLFVLSSSSPSGCVSGATRSLRQIDLETGTSVPVRPPAAPDYEPVAMAAVPGTDRLVVTGTLGSTRQLFQVVDVDPDGSRHTVAQRELNGIGGFLLATDDGLQVVTGRQVRNLSDLSLVETIEADKIEQVTAEHVVSSVWSRDEGELPITVQRRADGARLNSFTPDPWDIEAADAPGVADAVLVGDTLWTACECGDRVALYRSASATRPAPDPLFGIDPIFPYVGDTAILSGTVRAAGDPQAGVEVRIYDEDTRDAVLLDTVTTDADGQWSYAVVARPGWHRFRSEIVQDGRRTRAHMTYGGIRRPTYVHVTSPETVAPQETIDVRGTLYAPSASGVPDARVDVLATCVDGEAPSQRQVVTTAGDGTYGVDLRAGACDRYKISASYAGDAAHTSASSFLRTDVDRERMSLTVDRSADRVLPGQDLTFTVSFRDEEGSPVAGRELTVVEEGDSTLETRENHPVTDADGRVVVAMRHLEEEGAYCVRAHVDGDPEHTSAQARTCAGVYRNEPRLTVEISPTSARLGDTVEVTGQLTGAPQNATLDVDLPDGTQATVRTDDTGRYRLSMTIPENDIPSGKSRAVVSYAGDDLHRPVTWSDWIWVDRGLTAIELDPVEPTTVGEAVPVSGRLVRIVDGVRRPCEGPVTLTVGSLDEVHDVRTEDDGSFVTYTRPVRADDERHVGVRYAGTPLLEEAEATAVHRAAPIVPLLSLRAERSRVSPHDLVVLRLDIDRSASRQVRVVERDEDGARRLVYEGPVPDGGHVVTADPGETTKTYVLTTPADESHASARVEVTVEVGLDLSTTAPVADQRRGSVLVVKRATRPVLRTVSSPARPGACVTYAVQRRVGATWRRAPGIPCRRQDGRGVVRSTFTARPAAGATYRVRAVFPGDARNAASRAPWVILRFR